MTFINMTNSIGIIIASGTNYATGDIFLTLLFLMFVLVAFAIMFGIQLEFTTIFILPLLLGYMAYYSTFIAIGSVILIYLAIVFSKKFFIK